MLWRSETDERIQFSSVQLILAAVNPFWDYHSAPAGVGGVLWWACPFVCLSASISRELLVRYSPNFCIHGASVFPWQHRDKSGTSGFVSDVIFAHILTICRHDDRHRCCQWRHCVVVRRLIPRCVMLILVASCPRRQRVPRLDESIMQGVSAAGGGTCSAPLPYYRIRWWLGFGVVVVVVFSSQRKQKRITQHAYKMSGFNGE